MPHGGRTDFIVLELCALGVAEVAKHKHGCKIVRELLVHFRRKNRLKLFVIDGLLGELCCLSVSKFRCHAV